MWPYDGIDPVDLICTTIKIQTRWRERRQILSVYPLDTTKTSSAMYKLYMQYKGVSDPTDKFIESFKVAGVPIPKRIDCSSTECIDCSSTEHIDCSLTEYELLFR